MNALKTRTLVEHAGAVFYRTLYHETGMVTWSRPHRDLTLAQHEQELLEQQYQRSHDHGVPT